MALETGDFIDDLVATNPADTDSTSQGAAHLRLIKDILKKSFPNFNAAVTATASDLNFAATTVNNLVAQKMLFSQSAAPTGWTQDTSQNDRVLRIVSGTGGGIGGSWTLSGISVNGHALTEAEMPSHNHSGSTGSAGNHAHGVGTVERQTGDQSSSVTGFRYDSYQTGPSDGFHYDAGTRNTNSAGAHSHSVSVGIAGSDNAHTHGLTFGNSWRPSYQDVIAATKDVA